MVRGDRAAADERSDADLLAAHVAGDHDAFGELFARHRDRLWAVALRTMGNPEDAADGLQDGLVAAYRRAGSFRGEAAVTTWLHRVVVNACLDRIRAAKVRRAEALPDDLDEGARPRARTITSTPDDPADHALRRRAPPRRCWRRWPRCPPSSARRWCWSTWRATPSPRSRTMLGVRRGHREVPVLARARRGSRCCSACGDDARVTRATRSSGTRPRSAPVRSTRPRGPPAD